MLKDFKLPSLKDKHEASTEVQAPVKPAEAVEPAKKVKDHQINL